MAKSLPLVMDMCVYETLKQENNIVTYYGSGVAVTFVLHNMVSIKLDEMCRFSSRIIPLLPAFCLLSPFTSNRIYYIYCFEVSNERKNIDRARGKANKVN